MKYAPHWNDPNEGDLRVWHIPQLPMEAFRVAVDSVEQGRELMAILAAYDDFQYRHNVKPDYSSVQGIERWEVYDSEGDWWDLEEDEVDPR